MTARFARIVLIWVLALVTVWIADRVYRGYAFTVDEPKPVVPEGRLSDVEKSTIELFRATAPSVASITTEQFRFNPLVGVVSMQGAGSGFIWDKAGHVVTNFHVIKGASNVSVQLRAGDPIRARVVGGSEAYDIAVVELRDPPRDLVPLPIGDSKNLQVGQAAFAIGNPFGLSRTLTTGVVSALERHLPTAAGREVRGVIQTDAAINPGNSGRPLIDSSGRLIGVTTAILSESGTSAGVGLAIPVDLVNRVVPQIIKTGRAAHPGIGIAAADERISSQLGVKGVVVLGVTPGSPAERAGLHPFNMDTKELGDVIVAVDGKPVATVADLAAALDASGVGKEVTLTLRSGDDSVHDVKMKVIDLPD